ncbi:type II toxin-antitoxin system MqsR family toxin [Lacticaseibacillus paracasei]|uniref:type II toxin-antitoxin system MqsR family toxin n=1 Tax=Lacticaseibacillus paracasei TaxID=1597 RepID=UPI003593B088
MSLIEETLAKLKYLVNANRFDIVRRREPRAQAVAASLAKVIVRHLTVQDYKKHEQDRDFSNEYVWVFKTEYGAVYYIKFKIIDDTNWVKFISFHENYND